MKLFLSICLSIQVISLYAQDHGFSFGRYLHQEVEMKLYEKDTSAQAVVLSEFGDAYFQNDGDYNLIFEHHFKIKILKKGGLDEADIEIPLYKYNSKEERLLSVKASAFNFVNRAYTESPLNQQNIFTDIRNKDVTVKKFAIPNVKVGSIIEVMYSVETPFIFKFHPWFFQSNLPKIRSEYWATIPGNYIYNITSIGFQQLASKDSEIIKECFSPGGNQADCARYKFVMVDIPAFVKEEYMTAPSNYISALNFELSEIKYFDGRVDKITKEWKDVEDELKRDSRFGVQLKRGRDIVDEHVELAVLGETDPLKKAKRIYDFIRGWYMWDEEYSKYSEVGIKKAFNSKKGNVADINLSLIAALKSADLEVEPFILSTRDNGLPIEVHPVLSDFNYVIAKLNIGDKVYLLDATDDFVPFGMLPTRCMNGKGRVLGEKESYWYDVKTNDKRKKIVVMNLKLDEDGFLRGTLENKYLGYEAVNQRKKIYSFANQNEYINDMTNSWNGITVKDFKLEYENDVDKPLVENINIEVSAFDGLNNNTFFFNPFFMDRMRENPFKSTDRLYPVDFASPLDQTTILTIDLPEYIELNDLPAKKGLALPNAGGRYVFEARRNGSKITLSNSLVISKSLFSSEEYHYLKELFDQIIQFQNTDLVLTRKVVKN